MDHRFKARLTAGILTVVMHAVLVGGLAVHSPVTPALTAANAPVFQVSLLATPKWQASPQQIKEKAPEATAPEETRKNGKGSETPGEHGDPGTSPDIFSSTLQPAWADWLPQLSNTPLMEHFPFFERQGYFSTSELQERPVPEEPIIIPFPDAPFSGQKMTAILLLYIGADGAVERVEIDQSELPPEFEQAAIDTFIRAKMRPGIKDGKPVPVRMKIEVGFEAK